MGFLWASNADTAMVAHLESLAGGLVILIDGTGQDGQYFFLQANDPWLLNPSVGLRFLDFPTYMAQRMLDPVMAGLGGLLRPSQILGGWSSQISSPWVPSWGLGRLAASVGMSRWVDSPLPSIRASSSSWLSTAAPCLGGRWQCGVWLRSMNKSGSFGSALFARAVLARETILLVAGGAFAFIWFRDHRPRPSLMVAPVLAGGICWLLVRRQLESLRSPP